MINRMIGILALSLFFNSSSSDAESLKKYKMYERNQKGKIEEVFLTLPELLNQNFFETKHFKIVFSTNEEALPTVPSTIKGIKKTWDKDLKKIVDEVVEIDVNQDLIERAASVVHHLEKARNYFLNELKIYEINDLPKKAVIRLEMPYAYNENSKWDLFGKQVSNNVQTITAEKSWNSEIWFRPKEVRSLTDAEIKNQREYTNQEIKTVRKTFLNLQSDMAIRTVVMGSIGQNASWSFLYNAFSNQMRSFLIGEVLFEGFRYFTRIFENRSYYAIPELIPEVIYHEYSHYAFQKYLKPSHSIPAPEAIANFYASQMIHSNEIAAKFKKAFRGKKTSGKDHAMYSLSDDASRNARNDFAFSFLYQLQEKIQKCRTVRLVTESIRSGKLITTEATLNVLKNTLLSTSFKIEPTNPCLREEGELGETQFTIQDKLNDYFHEKGME